MLEERGCVDVQECVAVDEVKTLAAVGADVGGDEVDIAAGATNLARESVSC